MKRPFLIPVLYVAGLIAVLVIAALSRPEQPVQIDLTPARSSPMVFPRDYRATFVQYLTVDRSDATVRKAFIQPALLARIESGQPLPIGTQIVIEAYSAKRSVVGQLLKDGEGHLIPDEMLPFIHIAEKRTDWPREAIASSTTLDGWNFETFDSQTFLPRNESRADCFTCHDSGAFQRDFVFSRSLLDAFIRSDETQYFYCNRPERAPCF